MKKTVFIFHGTGGYPKENWFPWLKREIEQNGYQVFVPQFPNADNPNLGQWLKELDKYKQYIDENTIFVGHSLGGLFILDILEQLETSISAAFLVAAPIGLKPIKFYEGDYAFGKGFNFDWQKIKKNAKHFVVFHSDNDPYVGLENGKQLARHLGVELTLIPNAGHFNTTSGYTSFPQLYDELIALQ